MMKCSSDICQICQKSVENLPGLGKVQGRFFTLMTNRKKYTSGSRARI
jgi:hypothetical protein